jgi:hypothetical protein
MDFVVREEAREILAELAMRPGDENPHLRRHECWPSQVFAEAHTVGIAR